MALFLIKPVLWNTNNYRGPSGIKAAPKSFPGTYGYGHEEWNNSPHMSFIEGNSSYRVFHTESIKSAPVDENAGQIFVFMIASHDRTQELVGIAGNSMYLGHDSSSAERARIAKRLKLDTLYDEVWNQPLVQKKNSHRRTDFRKEWERDVHWIPNWICLDESFWWLDKPVRLDPTAITGAKDLPKMFSSYMPIELSAAEVIMGFIPKRMRGEKWRHLVDAMRVAPSEQILRHESKAVSSKATSLLTLTQARIGQGQFRTDLLQVWGNACAVTGLAVSPALKASHIKPWKVSSNSERLDPDNGLLLSANLDALFDAGMISFSNQGDMLIANELDSEQRYQLGIPQGLRIEPNEAQQKYLEYHRKELFAKAHKC